MQLIKGIKSQRGDTILEVLISVAVLSLILVASFTLANRSTQATRQAAERGEAYKIAQSDMEKLKLYLATPGITLPDEGDFFCISDDATTIYDSLPSSSGFPFSVQDDDLSHSIYSAADAVNECKNGINDLYYTIIHRGTSANDKENTYTAYVRWPAITGNGTDQSTLVHRIYPDLTSEILETEVGIIPTGGGSGGGSGSGGTGGGGSGPPTPPPSFTINGSDERRCIALTSFPDTFDGCFDSGNSLYAWRNVDIQYDFSAIPSNATSVTVTIRYQQYPNPPYPGGFNIPPDGYNRFIVRGWFDANSTSPADDISLPIPSNSSSHTQQPPISRTYPVPSGANKNFNILWWNDSAFGNRDANIQINSIEVQPNL